MLRLKPLVVCLFAAIAGQALANNGTYVQIQTGSDNQLNVKQRNGTNRINVTSLGDSGDIDILQTGNGHVLNVRQELGLDNEALITQSGYGHRATLVQSGVMNSAMIDQSGFGQTAYVEQHGARNVANAIQR